MRKNKLGKKILRKKNIEKKKYVLTIKKKSNKNKPQKECFLLT